MTDEPTQAWPAPEGRGGFQSTRWSQVLASRDRHVETGTVALEQLCRQYWMPIYGFIRRRGYDRDQAQDLTQGFFAELLERDGLAKADPELGRFRSFIKTLADRYLANEFHRQQAQKRGGGRRLLSLDWQAGEQHYALEPASAETAESIFERQWALTVLDTALTQLGEEYRLKGREELFAALRVFLVPAGEPPPYADLADQMGLSVTALKVSVHRLRGRFRDLIRQVVADTLERPEEIDDEIRQLLAAVRVRSAR